MPKKTKTKKGARRHRSNDEGGYFEAHGSSGEFGGGAGGANGKGYITKDTGGGRRRIIEGQIVTLAKF